MEWNKICRRKLLTVASTEKKMGWNYRYSLGSYVKSALWIVPFIALLLHVALIRLVYVIDETIGREPPLPRGGWGAPSGGPAVISSTPTLLRFSLPSPLPG